MSLPPGSTRNRINPVSVSIVEQPGEQPYVTYDQVTLCAEPNCPVCRAQRRDAGEKHRHHHKRQRRKKHRTNFWNNLLPRAKSSSSTVSVHSIELGESRAASTMTRMRQMGDEDITQDAWTSNGTRDDEVVCCRAYTGCRCPCWCCIILILLFVILIIILIVLLATLL